MNEFSLIPVIDLQGDVVVHARGGKRADYGPIKTSLGSADDPVAIARALLAITGAPILYIADLDAIEGVGNHFEVCRELADAFPGTALWIDAGFAEVSDCAFWLPLGAVLIIGSESLASSTGWDELHASFGNSLVLSLDFAAGGFAGPPSLQTDPGLWPDRVIAMNLPRIGTGEGPDLQHLNGIVARAATCAVYAAGGIRNIPDLEAIEAAGAQGALLATALHDGSIGANEIAAFLRRRRS
jgi:HisA/HisF family protein